LSESDGYRPDLTGKRVKHNCGDPRCPLKGIVVDVIYMPSKSLKGEHSDWWAVVKWDEYHGTFSSVPLGYTQPMPISKVEVIE